MAFLQAGLEHWAGNSSGNAPQLWGYKTADNITDLDAANYWDGDGAYERGMRAGDVVVAVCADGGAILHVSALTKTTSTAAIFA